MTETFREGEHVNIHIQAASVVFATEHAVRVTLAGTEASITIPTHDDEGKLLDLVQIGRQAPAEWPPRYGDIWRDGYGALWTVGKDAGSERNNWRAEHRLQCLDTNKHPQFRVHYPKAADVLADFGPFELIHRAFPDPEGGEDE
jgi:hypothetical protein